MAEAAAAIAQWNPTEVLQRAKGIILNSNYEKVADARQLIDTTIAEWVATVQQLPVDNIQLASIRMRGLHCVQEIWIAYAALEMELRQFKQATKVFENAVQCVVAGHDKEIWLRYASFCIERKKFANARKIFLRALTSVKEDDQPMIWTKFHEFVQAHVDPSMSLEALKAQVAPERTALTTAPPTEPTAATEKPGPVSVATPATGAATTTTMPASPVKATSKSAELEAEDPISPPIDPSIAFVDRTGQPELTVSPQKRPLETCASIDPAVAKKPKTELNVDNHTPSVELDQVKYFLHIPTTLPYIPGCPYLLFDPVADGESQNEIPNELLERLSDVLGDSAVFQGVKDLQFSQRKKDRDTLYRWQELVGTQMKEGAELFARHADLEKDAIDVRALIALKTQHLEQRREFVSRCQMSQQQFIEICEMDRINALKAQQISLENMKIPEMSVSMDAQVVGKQRAIVSLILEAEKLWRAENTKTMQEQSKKPQTAAPQSRGRREEPRHARNARSNGRRSHPRSTSSAGSRGGGRSARSSFDRPASRNQPPSHHPYHRPPPAQEFDHAPRFHAPPPHRDSRFSGPPPAAVRGGWPSQPQPQPQPHRDFHGPSAPPSYGTQRSPKYRSRPSGGSSKSFGGPLPPSRHNVGPPPTRFHHDPPPYEARGGYDSYAYAHESQRAYHAPHTHQQPPPMSSYGHGGRGGGHQHPPPQYYHHHHDAPPPAQYRHSSPPRGGRRGGGRFGRR